MFILYLFVNVLVLILCEASHQGPDSCAFTSSWLESVVLSMKLNKKGFHRDLLYEVQHDPTSHPLQVLLVQRLPCGLYMDQYQLMSLKDDTGLQVLLDPAVDLESPAHMSSGFSALVFFDPLKALQAVVPVHGRYHKPSSLSALERVTIESPKLLLRQEQCVSHDVSSPHTVMEAPCTIQNQSLCSWLEIRGLEVPSVSLEIPVGDASLTFQVCLVTTLVTLFCSIVIFKAVWKNGILQN